MVICNLSLKEGYQACKLGCMGIQHVTNKSAKDPEATGLVEAFMRHLKKIFHTAGHSGFKL